MNLEKFNTVATNTKLANLFLGFFEGLFIDGEVHSKEIKALITWVETYPECINIPHFTTLYDLFVQAYEEPLFLLDKKNQIKEVFKHFRNSDYFIHGTADIQRLHGVLAGVICDQNLRCAEVLALADWLSEREYLNEHFIFIEVRNILQEVKHKRTVSQNIKNELIECLKKYINIDDEGLPLAIVSAGSDTTKNPDFYHEEINVQDVVFCLTGASNRFMKSEWKALIEAKGGIFTDNLTRQVNYLVICNKGNPHWAQMSYGRKFELARKMQSGKHSIRILTEDHFASYILN